MSKPTDLIRRANHTIKSKAEREADQAALDAHIHAVNHAPINITLPQKNSIVEALEIMQERFAALHQAETPSDDSQSPVESRTESLGGAELGQVEINAEAALQAAALFAIAGTAIEIGTETLSDSDTVWLFKALTERFKNPEKVLEIAGYYAGLLNEQLHKPVLEMQREMIEAQVEAEQEEGSFYVTAGTWQTMLDEIQAAIAQPVTGKLEVGFDMMSKIELAIAKNLNFYPLPDVDNTH